MKKFKISVDLDNAAFDDDASGPEIARILRALASDLEEYGDVRGLHFGYSAKLKDISGNTCGQVCLGDDDDDEQDTCPEHRQPIERCPARCMDDEEAMALVARILLADAAPDLLAACVATLAHCEPFYGEDEAQPACFDAMRAAILKAKGA